MSYIRPKYFTKKMDVNLVSGLFDSVRFVDKLRFMGCSDNEVRVLLYKFLRLLRSYKISRSSTSEVLGWRLQIVGFYVSMVELERKKSIANLRKKILTLGSNIEYFSSFNMEVFDNFPKVDNKVFFCLCKGLKDFDKFYSNSFAMDAEKQILLKVLKVERAFCKVYSSRLYVHAFRGKKKYKDSFFYITKRIRKVNSILRLFFFCSLKFKTAKSHRKRFFKRMAWKIKKQKRWKQQSGLFKSFRFRQKLSQLFYIPKHFEINYKTFATIYLGYTDVRTTNTRVTFWLNLRKLVTLLSSG